MIVDSSILFPLLADDGVDGKKARLATGGQTLCAPSLIDLEVVSSIRGWMRGGKMSYDRALSAVSDLQTITLRRFPHEPLLPRIWELRDNLTPYDAAYVALAEELDQDLSTADVAIARAPGLRCKILLVE